MTFQYRLTSLVWPGTSKIATICFTARTVGSRKVMKISNKPKDASYKPAQDCLFNSFCYAYFGYKWFESLKQIIYAPCLLLAQVTIKSFMP
jgi:hypothetical protein